MVAVKNWKAAFIGNEQQLLQRRILFTPAQRPASSSMQFPHLEPLNDLLPSDLATRGGGEASTPEECVGRSSGGKQQQLREDCEREDGVWLAWEGPIRIGAGLQNLGNTCFLNSVLQCMTYTPPLAKYLRSGQHKVSCHVAGFCAVCALEAHVKQVLSSTNKIISPQMLVKNLRCISRAFQPWRQEDAHEYMRYLVEALHKCLSSSMAKSAPSELNESLVYKIFGGRLRSQVKCTNCWHCSETFDPFLDLSLEIVNADSLSRALANFTKKEVIDGNNKYHCEKCKLKVRAIKCFTIDSAPNILTLQFKRFSNVGHYGGKIDKKVDFGQTLDITPFLSKGQDVCKYKLYAVLVHSGGSTRSGHYYCFVRTSTDIWHILDDSRVKQVSEKAVLEQKAYMLFYVRDPTLSIPERASISTALPCKTAHADTLKVLHSGRIDVDHKLVSVPTKQHVGKSYAVSNGVTGVQPFQPKGMQQAIGLKGAKASSLTEAKGEQAGHSKIYGGEMGLYMDGKVHKNTTFQIASTTGTRLDNHQFFLKDVETDVKRAFYQGRVQVQQKEDLRTDFPDVGKKSRDISKADINEEHIPASMVDRTDKDPKISSTHSCNVFSRQQKMSTYPKTFTAQDVYKSDKVEALMKDSRTMESHIEHEGCKDSKRAGKKKPQLHHLKFLKMVPRARNVLLAKALSFLKKGSKAADLGCHNVSQANGIATGTVKNTASRKKSKKRKRGTAAFYVTSRKRLRANDQGGLENKDCAGLLYKHSSPGYLFTNTEAGRVAMPKSCEESQSTRKEQFAELNNVMKKKEVNMILSVAESSCNDHKPKMGSRHIHENSPRGLRVPESANDCARDDGLGGIAKIPRTLPSLKNQLFGLEVASWNGVDDSKQYHHEINNLLNLEHNIFQKKIDAWDEEYDRGKIKKVRKRVVAGHNGFMQHQNGNPFQILTRPKNY